MRKSCDLGAWGLRLRTAGRTKLVFPSAGLCLHSLQEFSSSPLNGSCGFACFILAGRQPINVHRDSRGKCVQKHPNSQVYIKSLSDAAFIISVSSAPSSPPHFRLMEGHINSILQFPLACHVCAQARVSAWEWLLLDRLLPVLKIQSRLYLVSEIP